MRFVSMLILTAMVICCSGCNRKRNLSDIPIKPNLTMEEYEDLVGTPSRIGNSNHWIAYNLKSGGELRLFFFNGPREGPSHAFAGPRVQRHGQHRATRL